MKDRFKFRAWDRERKKWVKQTGNPYIFPFEGRTVIICAGSASGYIGKEDYSEFYILVQSTGLKDKNGKLVFEGDILESKSEIVRISTGKKTGEISIKQYIVEWHQDQGRWAIRNIKKNTLGLFAVRQEYLSKWYTIVGNIHENPELLDSGEVPCQS